jgi:hypothetical protein
MDICTTVQPLLAEVQPGLRNVFDEQVEVLAGRRVACHLYPESTPEGAQS